MVDQEATSGVNDMVRRFTLSNLGCVSSTLGVDSRDYDRVPAVTCLEEPNYQLRRGEMLCVRRPRRE